MGNVIIMGAAGRDFHNFNVYYRQRPQDRVVAFTAAQIPHIAHRSYPPELAGDLYPKGIPIHPEQDLPRLIAELRVDQAVFAYSDISYLELMHKASVVLAAGASFTYVAERLGTAVGASRLVVLTDVPGAALSFSSPRRRFLREMTSAEARRHLERGEFAPGSMGPKVEACLEFLKGGGDEAVIAATTDAAKAFRNEAGTRLTGD
ncbi:MAG: hypothetical protein HYY03_02985 [Chloroflexi bacterium]|nr:hypothetical protein [Chloroflexota bacterium]